MVTLLWSKSLLNIKKFNHILPAIQKISGLIMILLGILLLNWTIPLLAAYLVKIVPFSF
ncbi:hypothetical protein [Halalkalibacter wakoensis]|uniref:hypothetical protein n=1 Tax=Halalkalibacter wakoensis TaxID=127891 RepID=UPI0012E2A41A|nr:hypothetical protein [Halalkalibacter wakoensis]